jgi:anti-anti-sigma factor
MNLKVLCDDDQTLRVQLAGRIVLEDFAPENDPLEGLLHDRGYARPLLVDLSGAEYIDSSGLAMLLGWHKRLSQAGGRLVLHSIPVQLMDTLRILRMELVLAMAKDEPAALALARGESG